MSSAKGAGIADDVSEDVAAALRALAGLHGFANDEGEADELVGRLVVGVHALARAAEGLGGDADGLVLAFAGDLGDLACLVAGGEAGELLRRVLVSVRWLHMLALGAPTQPKSGTFKVASKTARGKKKSK